MWFGAHRGEKLGGNGVSNNSVVTNNVITLEVVASVVLLFCEIAIVYTVLVVKRFDFKVFLSCSFKNARNCKNFNAQFLIKFLCVTKLKSIELILSEIRLFNNNNNNNKTHLI